MVYVNLVRDRVSEAVGRIDQSAAHKMDHLARVVRNARQLSRHYPEADAELLELACLLHDVEQPYFDKKNHVARSMSLAEQILRDVGYPAERAARVLSIISEHSTETIDEVQPSSIEAKILFDADKIDGVGASGITRVILLSNQLQRDPKETVAWYKGKIDTALRNMQTSHGRAMALPRLALTEEFLRAMEEDLELES